MLQVDAITCRSIIAVLGGMAFTTDNVLRETGQRELPRGKKGTVELPIDMPSKKCQEYAPCGHGNPLAS